MKTEKNVFSLAAKLGILAVNFEKLHKHSKSLAYFRENLTHAIIYKQFIHFL